MAMLARVVAPGTLSVLPCKRPGADITAPPATPVQTSRAASWPHRTSSDMSCSVSALAAPSSVVDVRTSLGVTCARTPLWPGRPASSAMANSARHSMKGVVTMFPQRIAATLPCNTTVVGQRHARPMLCGSFWCQGRLRHRATRLASNSSHGYHDLACLHLDGQRPLRPRRPSRGPPRGRVQAQRCDRARWCPSGRQPGPRLQGPGRRGSGVRRAFPVQVQGQVCRPVLLVSALGVLVDGHGLACSTRWSLCMPYAPD